MPNSQDILWFKQQFRDEVEVAVQNTPFTLDMLAALACQETGEVWPLLRRAANLDRARILELCVGDTLDSNRGRSAFPKTKADLVAKPNGVEMFGIARQGLVDMAKFVPSYRGAASMPNKFCHGFGIFQFDLQFFLTEPDYFLQKHYADFSECLGKCIGELRRGLKRVGFEGKATLTDFEMACVAIAYNTGGFKPSRGLKQGFKDGNGKFYGEAFFDFLRLAHTVVVESDTTTPAPTPPAPPEPGVAPLPPPTPVEATGNIFEVDVRDSPLNLRDKPDQTNSIIKAKLPDGQLVQAVSNKKVNGFLEVETSLLGAHFHGFVFAKFLKPAPSVESVPVPVPATAASGALPAVFMPRKAGVVTRRADPAGPHSLNEPGQPGRKGTTPDELRAELGAIIDWLAVDKASNKRYQPHGGTTFCNIYTHDYCSLAGIYLPRVWWSAGAIELLAQGQTVQPLLGKTIDEQRANDLFRWLRDFGLRFGWRQTSELSKLQQEVNQGAIGIIVARRTADGLSGHITAVVPETNDQTARRNAQGEVIAPVQSQAGVVNFRRSTGKLDWYKDARFAEHAFWLHS
ncbi:MAG: hypothetical protein QOJ70_256 [Acidobacteriota bacterium]|jgi:hypothetical protein|nr:hypothetical protein [Acidobacteriota bacterium]